MGEMKYYSEVGGGSLKPLCEWDSRDMGVGQTTQISRAGVTSDDSLKSFIFPCLSLTQEPASVILSLKVTVPEDTGTVSLHIRMAPSPIQICKNPSSR